MDVKICPRVEDVPKCPQPLLFRRRLKWDILQWDASQWQALLGPNSVHTFRKGPAVCSRDPLWERRCSSAEMEIKQFFDRFSSQSNGEWLYFDYKHISQHLAPEMISKLDFTWEAVGFPNKTAVDSTIWMGTEGAHTPCHVDTYGCNFVAQILGKKRWLLFPPSETNNLKPVRVPYEESSLYSSFNFYRGCSSYPAVTEAIMVDLEPGDVLYVPNGWWHYVENLTSAISINIWIPQDSDDVCRLKECLVKYFIRSVLNDMDSFRAAQLLNPNEDDLGAIPRGQIITELKWCSERIPSSPPSTNLPAPDLQDLLSKYSLPRTSIADIKSRQNIPHHCSISSSSHDTDTTEFNLIKAFCHPEVINLALEKFLELNSAASS